MMTESDEKQAIEEMAKFIKESCSKTPCFQDEKPYTDCDVCAAIYLYNAGYRRQIEAEWVAKKEMYRTPSAKNYYCSNCAKSAIFDSFMGVSRITKYCPDCGAHMKGGAE